MVGSKCVVKSRNELAEEYRSMCLWFPPRDFVLATDEHRMATVEDIERHDDRGALKRAPELRG